MAFSMVNNLCMQAVRAAFLHLPAASKRVEKALITRLCLVATSVPIYNTARTSPRPPYTVRRPRRVPLSRFKGAPPISAAPCLWPTVPNSGTWGPHRPRREGPAPRDAPKHVGFPLPHCPVFDGGCQGIVEGGPLPCQPG